MKGFLIAGTKSGIGKTTVSMGLMSCFSDVSPFKIGPDYIDGKFHEYVTGNKSYNLDFFLMGEDGVRESFLKHHKNFSIAEGVMGLYDGIDNSLDNGSSAHISRILNLPVILIVDGTGRSTSVAAEITGYQNFDRRVNIIGVIINRVSSEKTYEILKEAVEKYCKIKCFGYIPKMENISLSSRHLGLVEAYEVYDLKEKIEVLKNEFQKTIDLKAIYETAEINPCYELKNIFSDFKDRYKNVKIGIAKDSAFSFYYNDNIEFLENLGAEIKYFSPLKDEKIPDDVDMLYFGGGYPENYAAELENNISMINSIKDFYNKNGVIYGECGGFIYLSKKLITLDGREYNFVNLTENIIEMKNRLDIGRFGYINIRYRENLCGKGHEFHYSRIKEEGKEKKEFKIEKPNGRKWECGYSSKNLLCGYPHIHFFKSSDIIFDLLNRAEKSKEQK